MSADLARDLGAVMLAIAAAWAVTSIAWLAAAVWREWRR